MRCKVGLGAFSDQYGLLYTDFRGLVRAKLIMLEGGPVLAEKPLIVLKEGLAQNPVSPGRAYYVVSRRLIERMQSLLRGAWRGDAECQMLVAEGYPGSPVNDPVFGGINIGWSSGTSNTPNVLRPQDLWSFIRIAFLQDYAAGKTKVCQNPDCPTPYFLQKRKGQNHCCRKCVVLVNVRRFRKRQARHAPKKSRVKSGKRRKLQ